MLNMKRIDSSQAVRQFSELCNEAAFQGERIIITRHGKAVAALVPAEDVELIEAMEDKIDIEEARKALAEHRADPSSAVDAEEFFKSLGLKSRNVQLAKPVQRARFKKSRREE